MQALTRSGNLAGSAILLLAALACTQAGADESPPLFESEHTLQVRIEAPIRTLAVQRSDTEYLDGTFTYLDASGAEQALDLKIRARGNYRRQKKTCRFPPIRLNFRKKQVEGTEFSGQDKLKLVTHCNHRRAIYEQYILKEFMAYRIFKLFTDASFNARLLKVTWVDSEKDDDAGITRYAFLIEDDDLLGERIGASLVKLPRIAYAELDPAQASLVAVFEYFIGNTDYSMVLGAQDDDCCHNVVLFGEAGAGYLPVPYDFDFSGLVNARYAEPNPKLPIRSVLRRLYRGNCMHNDRLDGTFARFRENREAIRQIVTTAEGLDDKTRDRALSYLDSFYADIDSPAAVEENFLRTCLSAG